MDSNLSRDEVSSNYHDFVKPKLQTLLKILKLDLNFVKSIGDNLFWEDENEITHFVYDFIGGYGLTILGHNHPAILSELQKCISDHSPVHAQLSIRKDASEISKKINELLKSKLAFQNSYYLHLTNTGTEAIEAAIKHALMEWQNKKEHYFFKLKSALSQSKEIDENIIYELRNKINSIEPVLLGLEGAFHGKTAGSLAITYNSSYGVMFSRRSLTSDFIKLDSSELEVSKIFGKYEVEIFPGSFFSTIVGVFIEPIQGEGGVKVVSKELITLLSQYSQKYNTPIVFDEIQSGLYRTGDLLACSNLGIEPDYLTMGKSLGGGIAKISALLIRKNRYQEDFSLLHTSTFAEDSWSSRVCLKTLEILENDLTIKDRAVEFELKIREGVRKIESKYPGVIKEIRGQGFLLGVEFEIEKLSSNSILIGVLNENNLITYLFCSFILHKHQIRVAPTLSGNNTLRIEPSSFISDLAIDKLLEALQNLVRIIYNESYHEFFEHIFLENKFKQIEKIQKTNDIKKYNPSLRKVVFITHFIDKENYSDMDPILKDVPIEYLENFINILGPSLNSHVYFEQEILGANGRKINLQLRGITTASKYFEKSLLAGDGKAFYKVEEAVMKAKSEGASYVGLGQYTSIVSQNGLLLRDLKIPTTSGNSLTVGMTFKAFLKLASDNKLKTSEMRVGIVGITGNICSVLAQMVADVVKDLVVVHRPGVSKSSRFQKIIQEILSNSTLDPEHLFYTDDLNDLKDCDCVILGTNSTNTFLKPEYLKNQALVIDISVPTNIDPEMSTLRPDVKCIQGGLVKLPMGQKLNFPNFKTPDGEIYACLAETITLGILGVDNSYSLGNLNKKKIIEVLDMAEMVGMELGSFKQIKTF